MGGSALILIGRSGRARGSFLRRDARRPARGVGIEGMDRAALTAGPGLDIPIIYDGDCYELVKDISSGNFGVASLMRNRSDGQLVAVKYIERG